VADAAAELAGAVVQVSVRKFNTIAKVEHSYFFERLWWLTLSCGHVVSERAAKKPSVWYVEGLGRRRRKRCHECEAGR
jgi:hypothetical protein